MRQYRQVIGAFWHTASLYRHIDAVKATYRGGKATYRGSMANLIETVLAADRGSVGD